MCVATGKNIHDGPPGTDDIILYLKTDYHRLTDESVAATYKNRLFSSLPGLKHDKVHRVVEGSAVPPPPQPFIADLTSKLQEVVVNAVTGRPPPRRAGSSGRSTIGLPDNKWGGGCWHCGQQGHSRKQCDKFKKLIREHKGLPKEYEGEYEHG